MRSGKKRNAPDKPYSQKNWEVCTWQKPVYLGNDGRFGVVGRPCCTRDEASIAAVESGGFLANSEKLSQTRPSGEKGTYVKANWNRVLCDSSDPATVKLDYIFVSKPVKVLSCSVLADNRKGHYPSDHRPIMAVVKILK